MASSGVFSVFVSKQVRTMVSVRNFTIAQAIPLAAISLLSFTASPCRGQGYRVQPMRMPLTVSAGATAKETLSIRNIATSGEKMLAVRLVDMTQATDGNWRMIEDLSEGAEASQISCRSWVTLEESEIELGPLTSTEVGVTIEVPLNARGTYFAGILVEEADPPEGVGVRMVLRYCIPISIRIEGRPVPQRIRLSDLNLAYEPAAEDGSRSERTAAYVGVTNQGRTYSSLSGEVATFAKAGDRWQPVSVSEIGPLRILPLAELNLPFDLQKRLPPGQYRLDAELRVDGRRISPLSKEIEFSGTPGATTLPLDATLQVDKPLMTLDARPGAARTETLTIENASDEAVQVTVGARLPQAIFRGGSEASDPKVFSALPLLRAIPHQFTLRGQGKQNIRIMARVPRDDKATNVRYADLVLQAKYPDGQSAGHAESLVVVRNPTLEVQPAATLSRPGLSYDEEGKPLIQVKMRNTGKVHLTPKLQVAVLNGSGTVLVRETLPAPELLLPLQSAECSAILPTDDLESGAYQLAVGLTGEGGVLAQQSRLLEVEATKEGPPKLTFGDDASKEGKEPESPVIPAEKANGLAEAP